jgi:hypothetical protein
MSTISTGTTLTTALVQTGDTTGDLVIKTGASNTTAMTISGTDQSVTLAGSLTANGSSITNINATSITTGVLSQTNGGTGTTIGYNGFKNRIINGACMIDQRNAGASVTPTTDGTYTLDRWRVAITQASKFSAQQSSVVPAGFKNSMLLTSTSAYSITSGDVFATSQRIEGFNVSDLNWGTSNAQTVTLSFWVRSSLTGTFSGKIGNNAFDRSYVFSYTINAANTWEQKSVTITGDTTGTWATDNSIGVLIGFCVGAGSTFTTTAGSWGAGNYWGATGTTSVVGTSGATFYITGVQLEKGSTATSFDYRPYGTELSLCQRYYYQMVSPSASEKYFGSGFYYASTLFAATYSFPVTMRTAPTLSYVTGTGFYIIYTSGTQDAINAFSAVRTHPNGGGLDSDGLSTSGIQGAGGAISTNNAAAAVGFNAEL